MVNKRSDYFTDGVLPSVPTADDGGSGAVPELVPVPVPPPVLPMPDQVREVSLSDVEPLCGSPRTSLPEMLPLIAVADGARSAPGSRFNSLFWLSGTAPPTACCA